MYPNNQLPGAQPQPGQPVTPPLAPSPYGFILNAPNKPKQPLLKPNSLKSRLLIIVGGSLILMLLIIGVSTLVKRSGAAKKAAIISLVAEQQEVIRVANLGTVGSKDLLIQSWAQTASSSVGSQQKSLTKYLAARNTILLKTELSAKLDPKTDEAFKTASVDNRFTEVFTEKFKAILLTYAQDLKKNYNNVKTPALKKLLSDSYKSTYLLLK